MFFCYMVIERKGEVTHELCLVPDKPDPLARPIKVSEIEPTPAAVFRVGQEEAFTAVIDPSDGSLVITALEPAGVYFTPNLAAFPGMRVKHVKLMRVGEKGFRTFYSRDKAKWEEWVANRERV